MNPTVKTVGDLIAILNTYDKDAQLNCIASDETGSETTTGDVQMYINSWSGTDSVVAVELDFRLLNDLVLKEPE